MKIRRKRSENGSKRRRNQRKICQRGIHAINFSRRRREKVSRECVVRVNVPGLGELVNILVAGTASMSRNLAEIQGTPTVEGEQLKNVMNVFDK